MSKPAPPRYSDTISARRASSSTRRTRSDTSPTIPAPGQPCRSPKVVAMALETLREGLALLRREHFRGVRQGARKAPRRLVGEAHLLRPQRLDRGRVDLVLGQELDRLGARGARRLAQRREVLRRVLEDRRQALLLVLGGVDLDRSEEHTSELQSHSFISY